MENDNILVAQHGNIKVVKFNNPKKKNALNPDMYIRVTNILNEAAKNVDISVLVLTGVGDYYSSGNDLTVAARLVTSGNHTARANVFKEFVEAFITFPKLLVAVLNGPAIGIAATTLPLCDLVFASENSFIYTPFSKLGLVAEGSSTYTFPRLIGDRKAAEMLLFNHKMSAKEALECGFINFIYRPEEFKSKVWDRILQISTLPQHSITVSKKLTRRKVRDEMLKANEAEAEELQKVWTTDEYLNSLKSFVNKKSKV